MEKIEASAAFHVDLDRNHLVVEPTVVVVVAVVVASYATAPFAEVFGTVAAVAGEVAVAAIAVEKAAAERMLAALVTGKVVTASAS